MADSPATRASRGHRTLRPTIAEETDGQSVGAPGEFRSDLDDGVRPMPELFPARFGHGYYRPWPIWTRGSTRAFCCAQGVGYDRQGG